MDINTTLNITVKILCFHCFVIAMITIMDVIVSKSLIMVMFTFNLRTSTYIYIYINSFIHIYVNSYTVF
jgi:hypothetical protein